MIEIGSKAPVNFVLKDHNGDSFKISKITQRYIVLYFYSKDDTHGCTREACTFRDLYEDFIRQNAEIIGVSTDDEDSHKKFVEKRRLPFKLLVDEDKELATAYGVINGLLSKYFGVLSRATFLIGPERRILQKWVDASPGRHEFEVLETIQDLNTGEVSIKRETSKSTS